MSKQVGKQVSTRHLLVCEQASRQAGGRGIEKIGLPNLLALPALPALAFLPALPAKMTGSQAGRAGKQASGQAGRQAERCFLMAPLEVVTKRSLAQSCAGTGLSDGDGVLDNEPQHVKERPWLARLAQSFTHAAYTSPKTA